MEADVKLDCFGLLCPMPIIETANKIKEIRVGQILEVASTDEGLKTDMPAWCRVTGQEFLGVTEKDGEYFAYLRKIK